MRFRNTIRLFVENFKNVYRLLIFKLIVTLITSALCCAFVLPEIMEIGQSEQWLTLVEHVKRFLAAFLAADATELATIKGKIFENGSLGALLRLISSKATGIMLVALGCVLVYLFKRFIETVFHFAIGGVLNDKMSTYAETPLAAAFAANLGKASRYALVYVPVVFLFDLLMLGICYGVLTIMPVFVALFLSVTIIVACQSLKLTFTGQWMPAMTADGKRLFDSFRYKDKTERRQRRKMFSGYVVTVYLIIIVNAVAAVFTFGSALLLTVPASYMLLICQQYVNYYTIKGKKYFITYENIESSIARGDKEHFFEYITEEEIAEQTEAVKKSSEMTKNK